jgi:hypothetical protein
MRRILLALLGLLAAVPVPAVAQQADPDAPPPVLVIGREQVKPGKLGAHEKMSTGYATLFAKASPETAWLGLTPIAGDANTVLFLAGYSSFAAAEAEHTKLLAALDQNAALKTEMERLDSQNGDLLSGSQTAWFVYRPALSFHPPKIADVAKSRLVNVSTVRVKPGRTQDFLDYYKGLNAAREKANASWVSTAAYQSSVGAPGGTFVFFSFNKGMSELDELNAKAEERQQAIDAALGGEQAVKMRRELISDILVEPVTTNLYFINRSESRPSPQLAAADPDFWNPKPPAGKALATKKEASKPEAKPEAPKQ